MMLTLIFLPQLNPKLHNPRNYFQTCNIFIWFAKKQGCSEAQTVIPDLLN